MTPQIHKFESLPLRQVLIDDEPWFVGKDACASLGIANHADALSSMPDDERKGVGISDPLGHNEQQMICVSEPGLYRLIFKSRKPEAERFKRWVCHEVLPEIRRTGVYGTTATPVDPAFGADGTVPVAAYIALLQEKIALLEAKARPKPKRPPRVPMTDEEIATIRRLAAEGLSQSEIAAKTKRSSGSVSGALRSCPPASGDGQ